MAPLEIAAPEVESAFRGSTRLLMLALRLSATDPEQSNGSPVLWSGHDRV